MGARLAHPLPPIRIRIESEGKSEIYFCDDPVEIMKFIRAGVRRTVLFLRSYSQVERLLNGESLKSVEAIPEEPSNPLLHLGI